MRRWISNSGFANYCSPEIYQLEISTRFPDGPFGTRIGIQIKNPRVGPLNVGPSGQAESRFGLALTSMKSATGKGCMKQAESLRESFL